jgi:hypothetical protein
MHPSPSDDSQRAISSTSMAQRVWLIEKVE